MLLFDTPYNLSAETLENAPKPSSSKSRKRKRPADGEGEQQDIPAVNVERLLGKYHALSKGTARRPEDQSGEKKPKQEKKKRAEKSPKKQAEKDAGTSTTVKDAAKTTSGLNKRQRLAEKRKSTESGAAENVNSSMEATIPEEIAKVSHNSPKTKETSNKTSNMTVMQAKMKDKLDGARFRWINEQLYTSSGTDAFKLMQDDPDIFEDYHIGFRSQAAAWPTQPVEYIITSLLKHSKGVIVDVGCGDAQIAQKLNSKGYTVLSYDLVSVNAWVVAAQCAELIPLPGSQTDKAVGAIADIAVCCLSLMGTDWIKQVSEVRRVLKSNGLFKVAEVTSRFGKGGPEAFAKAVESVGFKLQKQDSPNTYFTVFDFVRTAATGTALTEDACADILKPCIYRKR